MDLRERILGDSDAGMKASAVAVTILVIAPRPKREPPPMRAGERYGDAERARSGART